MLEYHRVWTWKNTRSVVIKTNLVVCPWDWFIWFEKYSDYEMWNSKLQIGPFYLSFEFTTGNSSAEGWRGKFGLSECEAWKRSKIKPSS